ncbi:conjugative transfer signal peptidase TraF [Bartonella sp. F02]|uniref:conjugative transfer signal peptidase TraF n=1 Tax=Bartonella sp. F02 TaxID=2967262 RepID=UPI0022A98F29|nr:conjugative transfer signal peptidase TraF [Bartonella sp. F02]MCZ2328965.1 conjugative transfer signal peptidase TraF [Bartonella sp. F02]
MNHILKRFTIGVAVACFLIFGLGVILSIIGIRVNTTPSIPVGIYWASKDPIEKGSYVMFCPPPVSVFALAKEWGYIASGFCSGGYGYMMKKVVAAKEDILTVTPNGILVNGHLLPHSKLYIADENGRSLPRYQVNNYTLDDSELLLMSDINDLSFDGRYFGPINRSQIKTVIRPLITW